MTTWPRLLLFVASISTCALTALAAGEIPPDLVVQDLLAHDRLAVQALMHRDIDFLSKHIADDAIYVYAADGKRLTKRMYLATVLEQPLVKASVRTRHRDVSARVKGGVIELTATAIISVYVNGRWKDVFEGRGIGRYKKVKGEWISLGGTYLYSKRLS